MVLHMMEEVLRTFLSLFVIMGPFASIPVFMSVVRRVKNRGRTAVASQAVGIAAAVLFTFLFVGEYILQAFMIDMNSLRVGGGIILAVLGIELALGFSVAGVKRKYSPAVVLIGTPLLTGPGVIVTTMIFVSEYGHLITALGAIAALFLSWVLLWLSAKLMKVVGEPGLEIVSTVTGILLVAVAVNFIITGLGNLL
ncbi:MAG: MarC family protein [Candidatus Hadarchaeales archaeon]